MSELKIFSPAEAAGLASMDIPVCAGCRLLVVRFHGDDINKAVAQTFLVNHLASLADISRDAVIFEKTEHGKPFLVNREVHFNVSHSGPYWALAVHSGAEVGVDLEVWRDRARLEKVAERFFTDDEKVFLRTLSEDSNYVLNALAMWTRKEAFAKMKGSTILRELFAARDLEREPGVAFWSLQEPGEFVINLAVARSTT